MSWVAVGAAAIGAAGSIFGGMQQAKISKESIALQREIFQFQKKIAEDFHNLWLEKYKPVEKHFLDTMKAKLDNPYQAQYDAVESRATVALRREFALAREQIRRCVDPRCSGFYCHSNKQIAIEEARIGVDAVTKGWRAEEARKDLKDAQDQEAIFALLNLGRGLQTGSLNALNGASSAATAAAAIAPNVAAPYHEAAQGLGAIASIIANKKQANQYQNLNGGRGFNFSNSSYAGMTSKPIF